MFRYKTNKISNLPIEVPRKFISAILLYLGYTAVHVYVQQISFLITLTKITIQLKAISIHVISETVFSDNLT